LLSTVSVDRCFLSVSGTILEHMFDYRATPAAAVFDAADPASLLAELAVERPGWWMCAVLDELRDAVTTDVDREAYLICWERVLSWVQLRRSEAVAAAAAGQSAVIGPFGIDDFGADVVALVTGATTTTASRDVAAARTLIDELPSIRSALEAGEISWAMARAAIDATQRLPSWARQTVDAAMVSRWQISRDVTAWRRRLRREVLKVDVTADERRRAAVLRRTVVSWPLPDGMACVHAELRAQDARVVMAALSAIADKYGQADRDAAREAMALGAADGRHVLDPDRDAPEGWIDPDTFATLSPAPPWERTADQRRADALVDVCHDVLADPTLPTRHGRRPTVCATGGILTLLGLRDDPGELAGYGPISAAHLREIAADADWQRFLTAPDTGALIGIGTSSYRPRQALRDFLLGVRPDCDFPGCGVPSSRTDAEHTLAHQRGGDTDEHNVRPRCRRHHRAKTHAGWSVTQLNGGATRWSTPAGTHRLVPPHRLAGDEGDEGDGGDGGDDGDADSDC
jgi:hypothetical protein